MLGKFDSILTSFCFLSPPFYLNGDHFIPVISIIQHFWLKTLHLNVKHLDMRLLYYESGIIIVTLVTPVMKIYILLLKLMQ